MRKTFWAYARNHTIIRHIYIHTVIASHTALHGTALHYTALHCTTLHCTARHCITLHYTALHCTALHCITLHYTALHCITLHYTALHCITLHYIALHCITLHYTALHCITLHYIALHCTALHCTALTVIVGLIDVLRVHSIGVQRVQVWVVRVVLDGLLRAVPARVPAPHPGLVHLPLVHVLRHVLRASAQHVHHINGGELARHVQQRHVEVDAQLRVRVGVDGDGGVVHDGEEGRELQHEEQQHEERRAHADQRAVRGGLGEVLGDAAVEVHVSDAHAAEVGEWSSEWMSEGVSV